MRRKPIFPSNFKDDSEKSAGFLFIRAYNKWHGEIKKRLGQIGLTHPQFVAMTSLWYLSQGEENITQIMIARLAGTDPMTLSKILETAEKNGLVLRLDHPKDTRAKSIKLTEKGMKKISEALPLVENIDAAFFGKLDKDLHKFMELLNILGKK